MQGWKLRYTVRPGSRSSCHGEVRSDERRKKTITPYHDVFTLLKNRKEEGRDIPRLYTCCGTEDRRHQDSVDLKEFADQLGVPLLFEEGPGRHDDIFFDEYIQKILDWMNFAGKSVEE